MVNAVCLFACQLRNQSECQRQSDECQCRSARYGVRWYRARYFARGIDFVASRAIAINNCAAGLMLSFFKVTIAGLCFALESLFRAQELAALP